MTTVKLRTVTKKNTEKTVASWFFTCRSTKLFYTEQLKRYTDIKETYHTKFNSTEILNYDIKKQ